MENALAAALQALLDSAHAQACRAANDFDSCAAVAHARCAVREHRPEEFQHHLVRPLEQLIDGVLAKELSPHSAAAFLYRQADFVEHHLSYLFVRYEGLACSTDKARTVIRALARHFDTEDEIAFDYEQKYTFHLPKTVLRQHSEILAVFKALCSLYHGQPAGYLQVLADFEARQQVSTPTDERAG